MFKNYFLTATRSIKRNLSFSILNVLGLTLGIASCLVIFLVVKNELGYDTFNGKANRTYELYGLVTFAAAQRLKEVGIRKVLGASMQSIVVLFSKEFVLLIAVAFLIAAPLAYYSMHKWLENFAYHVDISAGIFIIAIATSFAIAGCTIAYQAIKAAVANPVRSLRTE